MAGSLIDLTRSMQQAAAWRYISDRLSSRFFTRKNVHGA
jgi:hypothetical protein